MDKLGVGMMLLGRLWAAPAWSWHCSAEVAHQQHFSAALLMLDAQICRCPWPDHFPHGLLLLRGCRMRWPASRTWTGR